jgi:hypothetical protein
MHGSRVFGVGMIPGSCVGTLGKLLPLMMGKQCSVLKGRIRIAQSYPLAEMMTTGTGGATHIHVHTFSLLKFDKTKDKTSFTRTEDDH